MTKDELIIALTDLHVEGDTEVYVSVGDTLDLVVPIADVYIDFEGEITIVGEGA